MQPAPLTELAAEKVKVNLGGTSLHRSERSAMGSRFQA